MFWQTNITRDCILLENEMLNRNLYCQKKSAQSKSRPPLIFLWAVCMVAGLFQWNSISRTCPELFLSAQSYSFYIWIPLIQWISRPVHLEILNFSWLKICSSLFFSKLSVISMQQTAFNKTLSSGQPSLLRLPACEAHYAIWNIWKYKICQKFR